VVVSLTLTNVAFALVEMVKLVMGQIFDFLKVSKTFGFTFI